ncbi:NAD(P)/FAD-dependent oxidoreductase [Chitinophaga pendula]|uniref:NAD(P)/FAD-dependent oxidoreductase n=1 Tax=Chitinophaga TaxID=79328 RepID=UPI000BAF9E2F|nr:MULTISPECIES: NAD(P)/FAD-dependent oxidoreductase [Chitinophaga]ASZ13256.1 pyridine nucleotide-disulfide oxidoreductase [Chitinophaga sp. MD30]UCJ09122.1 NAD(P)/FAD-dependent oxidoreductase [Chitinophaga pendula]
MTTHKLFDVIIIGGSYAGLAAAMSLGRSLRDVLVIDAGKPCNRQTPHSHNFLTQDGKTPQEIATVARQQVEQYTTIQFYEGTAVEGRKTEKGFEITTQSGDRFESKKLFFATGIVDQMPDIKGFTTCWGISVIHCPYCHGYEFRGQRTAIMANGEKAMHITSLVHNLTKDLTVLTNAKADFTDDQRSKLEQQNIPVIETPVTEIIHENGHVQQVVFSDGQQMNFDAVYAAIPFTQSSDIPEKLGCELTEQGFIKVGPFQQTNIEGVFAGGDNTTPMRSVASSVAAGALAGAAINAERCKEQF